MMHEHLPEVLVHHIEELREAQRPIERQREHVIPPDVSRHRLVRIIPPTLLDIPQPFLIPQHNTSIGERESVVETSPGSLTEFDQRGWLVLDTAQAQPTLNLTLRPIKLFG